MMRWQLRQLHINPSGFKQIMFSICKAEYEWFVFHWNIIARICSSYHVISKDIGKPVLKMKILESNLPTALTFGNQNQNGHHASVWHKDTSSIPNKKHTTTTTICLSLSLLTFYHGTPGVLPWVCIHSISIMWNSSVLVLSEHWLCPYELARLNDISDDYQATDKADSRLTETSNGGRGFGGIAILRHKSIGAIPVSDITSDRICVIHIQMTIDQQFQLLERTSHAPTNGWIVTEIIYKS